MLVGNDIVDLHDPESRPEALHKRFDARVFTSDELEALNSSVSAHALRWTLWAAKESAYKVAKKLDPAVRFVPRDFLVRRLAEGRALVVHETGPFDVRLRRTDEWVSAVATRRAANAASIMAANAASVTAANAASVTAANAPEAHRSVSAGIERLEVHGADPSQTVRELVCAALALRMNVPPGQVQIATDRGIPVARWRNRRLPVDLSLSHHGRFVAWAWVIGSPVSEAPAREPAA